LHLDTLICTSAASDHIHRLHGIRVSNQYPIRQKPALFEQVAPWLNTWKFDRFVTLAFNDPFAGNNARSASRFPSWRERLKKWDAHVNRRLFGSYWAERDADRLFAFYALEKPETNPHWHGLIRFFTEDPDERHRQAQVFDEYAARYWLKLVPKGSLNNQPIYDRTGSTEYVAKSLSYGVLYEHLIVADEFKRG